MSRRKTLEICFNSSDPLLHNPTITGWELHKEDLSVVSGSGTVFDGTLKPTLSSNGYNHVSSGLDLPYIYFNGTLPPAVGGGSFQFVPPEFFLNYFTPTALLTVDNGTFVGGTTWDVPFSTVVLDSSGSVDPDGTIVNYHWIVGGPPAATYDTATPVFPLADAPISSTYQVVVTDDDGFSTSSSIITVKTIAPSTLVHDEISGVFFYGYIDSFGSGALRCAHSFQNASFTTSGDALVDSGPVTNHAAFYHNGFLCYVFTKSTGIFLRESVNPSGFGGSVTIISGHTLLGVAFEQDSGLLYCLTKDSGGSTFMVRVSLNQQSGTWTVDSTTPAAVSGLGSSLNYASVIFENGQYTAIVKSGTSLNLLNSSDGVNYS